VFRRSPKAGNVLSTIGSQGFRKAEGFGPESTETSVTGGRRKKANGSPRILPGDWGKAGTGWLARPLWKWFARAMDGGKIHQFL
jgi:hypothetical protein